MLWLVGTSGAREGRNKEGQLLLKWTARDGKLLIYDFADDRWFIFKVCLLWRVTLKSQNVVAMPIYALFFLE